MLRRDGAVFWQDTARVGLEERLMAVFGKEWRESVLPLDVEDGG